MACTGIVFELYREIKCDGDDGDDNDYRMGLLKTGPGGSYIKMSKADSSGRYKLSMEPWKESSPPPEYLFRQLPVEFEGSKAFTFTNREYEANLAGNISGLEVYGMIPGSQKSGEIVSDRWLLREGSSDDGTNRLCVKCDREKFYFCIDQEKFILKKGLESEKEEHDGDFRISEMF